MPTILEIFMYKEEVTNLIRRVFPKTTHYNNSEDSFIYTFHEGDEYEVTFPKDLSYFIKIGIEPPRLARGMMEELVRQIIEGGESV